MGTTLTLAKAIWIWPQLTSTWSTLFSHVLLRRLSERFFRLIVFSVRPPLVLLKKSSPTRCTWRCRSLSTSWWLPGRWCSRWPGWSSPTHRYRPHVFREPGRSSMYSLYNNNNNDTVFLSRFGTFFRSEFQFSKPLVQSSHHCVACAHQKSSFSFLWTSCKCFGASIQMIMYNSQCHVDQNVL